MLAALRAYKVVVSPSLPAGSCRFTPSCADYASQAIAAHGALRGSWLAARRLSRCGPWGGHGFDPIPPGARSAPSRHSQAGHGARRGTTGSSRRAR